MQQRFPFFSKLDIHFFGLQQRKLKNPPSLQIESSSLHCLVSWYVHLQSVCCFCMIHFMILFAWGLAFALNHPFSLPLWIAIDAHLRWWSLACSTCRLWRLWRLASPLSLWIFSRLSPSVKQKVSDVWIRPTTYLSYAMMVCVARTRQNLQSTRHGRRCFLAKYLCFCLRRCTQNCGRWVEPTSDFSVHHSFRVNFFFICWICHLCLFYKGGCFVNCSCKIAGYWFHVCVVWMFCCQVVSLAGGKSVLLKSPPEDGNLDVLTSEGTCVVVPRTREQWALTAVAHLEKWVQVAVKL